MTLQIQGSLGHAFADKGDYWSCLCRYRGVLVMTLQIQGSLGQDFADTILTRCKSLIIK